MWGQKQAMKVGHAGDNNIFRLSDWVDPDHHFYDERVFTEVLRLERKRSERSGRPFLLMLIDVRRIVHSRNGKDVFETIVSQLNLHTRETDIKGWQAHKSVIGIIFTELGEHDKDFILNRITRRVQNNLFYLIESKQFQGINLSMKWFPNGDEADEDHTYEANPLFYPDLVEKAIYKVFSLYVKRVIDIIGSIAGLIIFLPLFLIIPILIKVTSQGPVFFRQERLGQFGKKFVFLKFRTMQIDNDDGIHRDYIRKLIDRENISCDDGEKPGDEGSFKIRNDPRVTMVGKFLRKTSLDELPQFINVLKGEMSLVGPRPPIPYEYDEYELWHMKRVIEVKPGITGLWQVEGRSSTSFDDMVRLDLKYIHEWSLWLDVKILLKTPWVVMKGTGAY
jgi:lipopolysaccharide/colanic/teichoic acid biosynthesis glycosyltransferase